MDHLTDDVIEFLSAGTRTGMFGYTAKDGRPLVAPVWFIVDDGQPVFMTGGTTAKGRYLQRDSRVVLTVDDPHPPYSFVQIQGTASTDDEPDEQLAISTRIARRYMGADKADEFGRRNAVPGELVVRIAPSKVLATFNVSD